MEFIRTQDTKEYKADMKKKKISKYIELDDFVNSAAFDELFNTHFKSVIDSITNNILVDESNEENEILYSRKMLKILLRKELIKIYKQPTERLKLLAKSLDTIGSTE
jgi:hypothetical protein